VPQTLREKRNCCIESQTQMPRAEMRLRASPLMMA
jgi:hypothetical protein